MDSVHSLARSGRTATTKRSSFAHVESLPPRLSAAAGPTFRWRRWGSVITSLPDALSESGTAEMLDTFGSARSTETDGEGAPLIMPLSVPWGASNTADPDAGLSQPLPRYPAPTEADAALSHTATAVACLRALRAASRSSRIASRSSRIASSCPLSARATLGSSASADGALEPRAACYTKWQPSVPKSTPGI